MNYLSTSNLVQGLLETLVYGILWKYFFFFFFYVEENFGFKISDKKRNPVGEKLPPRTTSKVLK